MLCALSAGCRTTWSPLSGPEPNFDRLIQIEQRNHSEDSALSYADQPEPPGEFDEQPVVTAAAEVLENDAEFQEDYAKSSPEGKALLDRFRDGLGDIPRGNLEKNSARSTAEDLAAKVEEDETSFHISDIDDISPPRMDEARRRALSQKLTTDLGKRLSRESRIKVPEDGLHDDAGSIAQILHRPDRDNSIVTNASFVDNKHDHANDVSNRRGTPMSKEGLDPSSDAEMEYYSGESVEPGSTGLTLRQHGHAMIEMLEKQIQETTNPDERILLNRNRRLINFVLDDLDAAQEPINGLAKETQSYFQNLIQGLYDATDINGNPVASRRLTLALQSHRVATNGLSKLANLEVLNPAFCTEVDSFGVVTPFTDYRFEPGQEVLLYCELENFVSRKLKNGYETQLQGSYEIIDPTGRKLADQLLPEDTDICGNQRKDFYIAYRLHMPNDVEAGPYKLKLIIEDMTGHKFGQATLDFSIVK